MAGSQLEKFKLFLGTSGYSYSHWKGIFYPENLPSKKFLSHYAKHFNAVELNVTFYRLPKEKTFNEWFGSVPEDFSFVLKAPKVITHLNRLKNSIMEAQEFLMRAQILDKKLRCILWQFPPGFKPTPLLLENFFREILNFNSSLRHAIEFRHKEAFAKEIIETLQKLNICLVCAHSKRFPCYRKKTADFSYFRFHGPGSLYNSKYSEEDLDDWADKIVQALKVGDVFVFFNNDFSGFAIENAIYLRKKIQQVLEKE